MESLIALPFQIVFTLLNVILSTTTNLITFTVNMVVTLLQALAPFATAALFFVSNPEEDKATLVLDTKASENKIVRISTPEDGEWFSQFFETDSKVSQVTYKNGKIVMNLPKEELKKDHYVSVNVYSLGSNKKSR